MNRQNIALARLPDVDESIRFKLITWLLAAMPPGRAMIFVPTVRVGNARTSDIARLLLQNAEAIEAFVAHPELAFLALGLGPRAS